MAGLNLFPDTTLFRSHPAAARGVLRRRAVDEPAQRRELRRGRSSRRCAGSSRSEEHTSELQSRLQIVCRLLHEKKKSAGMPRKQNGDTALIRAAIPVV